MIDSNKATAIRTVVIVVFAWPVAFTSYQPLSSISKRTWILLVLSGHRAFLALLLPEASQVAPVDKSSVVMP